MFRSSRRGAVLIGTAVAAAAIALAATPAVAATPYGHRSTGFTFGHPVRHSTGHTLGHVPLFVRTPDAAAITQERQLRESRQIKDAVGLQATLATPQAVWLDGGTDASVRRLVTTTLVQARVQRTVPVFVAYNIPGRDCAQFSAGGATNTADYEAWIDAISAGLGNAKAVVLLEPDSLGLLPTTDCVDARGLPADMFTSDQERFTELSTAVNTLEGDRNISVYLDGTHSAWQPVGTISSRLIASGVSDAQGFFLDVSNFQFTQNNDQYGTWISDCIALLDAGAAQPTDCPDEFYNGGPAGTKIADLTGGAFGPGATALSPYGVWSDTTNTIDLNTSGENARYAALLSGAGVAAATHFVVDTSRNGTGPNDMTAFLAAPFDQPAANLATLQGGNWCNPPGAGLGLRPTTNTHVPLVDAYLWVKTPGESDGACNAAVAGRVWDYGAYSQPGWPTDATDQAQFDPLWGQVDPAAGAWFPAQVLDLIKNAHQ